MRLASPLAHAALLARLWEARRRDRLPHALLLEGPEGVGKYLAATWFTAGVLCDAGPGTPCLACGPCKRMLSGEARGNHPDVFVLDPLLEDEEFIRVGRIAHRTTSDSASDSEDCVEAFLHLRALEGRGRFVLVREAHRMNVPAQNALLKTLEEPRPGTLLLLETHRADTLLPTILSRCVRLRFDALSVEECERVLVEDGLEPERAERLARWADGSPGAAQQLAARGAEESLPLLAALLLGERPPLACTAALLEVEGEFRGKSPLAKQRDRVRAACDLLAAILRDVVRSSAGLDLASLPHGVLAAEVRRQHPACGEEGWMRRLERVLETRADVDRNVSPDALLESVALVVVQGFARV